MKKNIFKFTAVLLSLLSTCPLVYAENTATISVSCTIPEIPGFNSPGFETQTIRHIEPQTTPEEITTKETQQPTATVIEEKQNLQPTAVSDSVTVKTIYAR